VFWLSISHGILTWSVRERKLHAYKAENYESTSEEWSSILQYALIFPSDVVLPSAVRDSLEITCRQTHKASKKSLTITLQTHVEDIKRRLGIIELSYSEDTEDVDLFGWAVLVVDTRDDLSSKLNDNGSRLNEAERKIESLKNHLDKLIAAKDEHETQLLSKFALLLNEKKLRIRTQQRQLAEADRPSRDPDSIKTSRVSRKRKQDANSQHSETGEESEGFEAMNVDNVHDDGEGQVSDQAQLTSSDTDTDTDEGPSLAQHSVAIPEQQQQQQTAQSPIPPPRTLPFGRAFKATAPNAEKSTDTSLTKVTGDDDDETVSEDDEL